ncbi:glycosyltransferase [Flavitalea sp.]|nr:glycosyltransferase [Flavitalea sp.]
MKILHVIFSFAPDGAETMLVDIINLQARTEEVDLMIVNNIYNKELLSTIEKNVSIHLINRKEGSFDIFRILNLNYRLFKIKPDIIHFHNHNGIRVILFKAIFKTCLTLHSVNKPLKYLTKYDKLFSISDAVERDIYRRGTLKSTVVYNGIDFSKIKVKDKYAYESKFNIVVISRLIHEVKGQHILLQALNVLIFENGLNNVSIDFIGEGPSLHYLEELTSRLGLKDCVRFLGLKDRKYIYDNLSNYHLLVQPSIYEGFGLTVVEGIAAKIPVLVSTSDGPLEIIGNGKYGFKFENGDAASCAEAIKLIISQVGNEDFHLTLIKACSYARDKFSIQTTAKDYLIQYNNLALK